METHAHMISVVFQWAVILSIQDKVNKTYNCRQIIKQFKENIIERICQISFNHLLLFDFQRRGKFSGIIWKKNVKISQINYFNE